MVVPQVISSELSEWHIARRSHQGVQHSELHRQIFFWPLLPIGALAHDVDGESTEHRKQLGWRRCSRPSWTALAVTTSAHDKAAEDAACIRRISQSSLRSVVTK